MKIEVNSSLMFTMSRCDKTNATQINDHASDGQIFNGLYHESRRFSNFEHNVSRFSDLTGLLNILKDIPIGKDSHKKLIPQAVHLISAHRHPTSNVSNITRALSAKLRQLGVTPRVLSHFDAFFPWACAASYLQDIIDLESRRNVPDHDLSMCSRWFGQVLAVSIKDIHLGPAPAPRAQTVTESRPVPPQQAISQAEQILCRHKALVGSNRTCRISLDEMLLLVPLSARRGSDFFCNELGK